MIKHTPTEHMSFHQQFIVHRKMVSAIGAVSAVSSIPVAISLSFSSPLLCVFCLGIGNGVCAPFWTFHDGIILERIELEG